MEVCTHLQYIRCRHIKTGPRRVWRCVRCSFGLCTFNIAAIAHLLLRQHCSWGELVRFPNPLVLGRASESENLTRGECSCGLWTFDIAAIAHLPLCSWGECAAVVTEWIHLAADAAWRARHCYLLRCLRLHCCCLVDCELLQLPPACGVYSVDLRQIVDDKL